MKSSCNETYNCLNKLCVWENVGENVDWGYLTKNNGNCSTCIDMCDNGINSLARSCNSSVDAFTGKKNSSE